MKKRLILALPLLIAVICTTGCQKSQVPSGTYTGTLQEVNAQEKEIYLKTDDGKVLELYFTQDTVLQQGGMPVAFAALEAAKAANAKVTVEVENVDGKLVPKKVTISG